MSRIIKQGEHYFWPRIERFSECVESFCREGPNAGKPGPCPDPEKAKKRAEIKAGKINVKKVKEKVEKEKTAKEKPPENTGPKPIEYTSSLIEEIKSQAESSHDPSEKTGAGLLGWVRHYANDPTISSRGVGFAKVRQQIEASDKATPVWQAARELLKPVVSRAEKLASVTMSREDADKVADAFRKIGGFTKVEVEQKGWESGVYNVNLWSVNPRAGNRTLAVVENQVNEKEVAAIAKKAKSAAKERDQGSFRRIAAQKEWEKE